jgi:hypothetical protein
VPTDAGISVCWFFIAVGPARPHFALGIKCMSRFQALADFERRFNTMDVDELRQWKKYWTQHAQQLASKVRKQAMKRVYEIDKVIERKVQQNSAGV